VQLVSSELAHQFQVVPKSLEGQNLMMYVSQVPDKSVQLDLELILNKKIVYETLDKAIFFELLNTNYILNNDSVKLSNKTSSDNFLETLIQECKALKVSDIHFEVFKNLARVRTRIDGKLIEKYQLEKEQYAELVNQIKIKSNLDITEKRLPQDGRINYDDFDIRVSILPTLHGEKMVLRILGRDTGHLSLEGIGFSKQDLQIFEKALKANKGIILISGPTGSGKTTTLYASLKALNKVATNILTIEDPIEYTLEGINQVQLKEDIGLTFTKALKTFLRQDPDIIMLGEIRDATTAEMAIRASLTGHLVLSTIHTNSALGTISRLIDMGIPSFLIAETLSVSVAQRLVRKLCNHCKIEKDFNQQSDFNEIEGVTTHMEPQGCRYCHYTGYKGRVAIHEVLPINEEVKVVLKQTPQDLNSQILPKSYSNLKDKAIQLIQTGVTSIEEVYSIIIEN